MSPKLLNILLIALPAVLFYGYLMPYYTGEGGLVWTPEKSIKTLQVENVLFANTLKQTGIIKDAAEKFEKDYNSFDADTKQKISTMLPDTIDPVKLRNEVINIAAKTGVAISGLKVEKGIATTNKEAELLLKSMKNKVRREIRGKKLLTLGDSVANEKVLQRFYTGINNVVDRHMVGQNHKTIAIAQKYMGSKSKNIFARPKKAK
jgi:hypothetical protein